MERFGERIAGVGLRGFECECVWLRGAWFVRIVGWA